MLTVAASLTAHQRKRSRRPSIAVTSSYTATGTVDRGRLLAFLNEHAAAMPRTMLRYAIEHLDAGQRAHYLGLRRIEGS